MNVNKYFKLLRCVNFNRGDRFDCLNSMVRRCVQFSSDVMARLCRPIFWSCQHDRSCAICHKCTLFIQICQTLRPRVEILLIPVRRNDWVSYKTRRCSNYHNFSSSLSFALGFRPIPPQGLSCTKHYVLYSYYSYLLWQRVCLFLPCDAVCTVSVIVILSVRLSVCLSHSWTVSTWFDLQSWFLHHRVDPSF